MVQATEIATTPPVIVVCSGAWATTMMVTIASTSMGLAADLGKHDVVLPLIPRYSMRAIVDLSMMSEQQAQSQISSQAYVNNAMCPQLNFLFQS